MDFLSNLFNFDSASPYGLNPSTGGSSFGLNPSLENNQFGINMPSNPYSSEMSLLDVLGKDKNKKLLMQLGLGNMQQDQAQLDALNKPLNLGGINRRQVQFDSILSSLLSPNTALKVPTYSLI